MSKMTVFKLNEKNEKEYVEIDIKQVDMIQKDGQRITYFMNGEKYTSIATNEELFDILMQEGFDSLDKSNIVNMKKIRSYKEEYRKVYFEDNPTENSYFATLANVKKRFVEPYIYRAIAQNKGTTLENVKMENTHHTKGIFRHSKSKE